MQNVLQHTSISFRIHLFRYLTITRRFPWNGSTSLVGCPEPTLKCLDTTFRDLYEKRKHSRPKHLPLSLSRALGSCQQREKMGFESFHLTVKWLVLFLLFRVATPLKFLCRKPYTAIPIHLMTHRPFHSCLRQRKPFFHLSQSLSFQ